MSSSASELRFSQFRYFMRIVVLIEHDMKCDTFISFTTFVGFSLTTSFIFFLSTARIGNDAYPGEPGKNMYSDHFVKSQSAISLTLRSIGRRRRVSRKETLRSN